MTDHSTAIEVTNLSKSFSIDSEPSRTLKERLLSAHRNSTSIHRALTDVSFTVDRGETFGVLGHNGSGKSTLLKIMAGTYRPTTGRVRVRGRLSALLELGAGFHPDLTGRENVYLNGSILGFTKTHIDGLFDDIVDFAGIEDFIDLQVKYYSSGMTARLGFAVATNLNPDVLLVDEVLAVGDEAFQAKCMERVHRFRSLGRTLVLVSHSAESVRELCDRAVVLHKGQTVFVGEVNEAIKQYRLAVHGPPSSREKSKPARVRYNSADQQTKETGISLVSAEVVRPDGQEGIEDPTFTPGEAVAVTVSYRVHSPTEYRIRLILRTEDNQMMVNASSHQILDRALQADSGDWTARFTLDDVPLLDGKYWFTVAAESPDGKTTYDRIHRLGHFVIKGPGAGYGRINVAVKCDVGAAKAGGTASDREPSTDARIRLPQGSTTTEVAEPEILVDQSVPAAPRGR